MLIIDKSIVNKIVMTITSDTNYTGSTCILNLTNNQTLQEYNITLQNTSLFTYRYDCYYISGTTMSGMTEAQYDYKVYDNTTDKNILELGRCFLIATTPSTDVIYQDQESEKIIYNP